jgi:hypothetical protein
VDDAFLRFLQKGSMVVELHQARAQAYTTVAVGKVGVYNYFYYLDYSF